MLVLQEDKLVCLLKYNGKNYVFLHFMNKNHTIHVMGNVVTGELFMVYLTIGNTLADFLYIWFEK